MRRQGFITRQWVRLVVAGKSFTDAARAVGIPEEKVYRWVFARRQDKKVQDLFEEYYAAVGMGRNELVARLAGIANLDLGEYMTISQDDKGKQVVEFDLARMKADGVTRYVRRWELDSKGHVKYIQPYSLTEALEWVGRSLGVFKNEAAQTDSERVQQMIDMARQQGYTQAEFERLVAVTEREIQTMRALPAPQVIEGRFKTDDDPQS